MTSTDDGSLGPRDVVVVMCRGASRRYGAPKALAAVGNDPRPLLARVAATYAGTGAGLLLVVALAELEAACRDCLAAAPSPPFAVIGAVGGGGTALTLAIAHDRLRARGKAVERVWAHPVDLPRVREGTIRQLARASAANPGLALRPVWGGQPGHPLVLPWAVLEQLAPQAAAANGPWLEVMANAAGLPPVLPIAVADPGTVLDHDTPDGAPGAPPGRD